MNYSKIYANFLADRRSKELALKSGAYFEKHHIVPRSLCGIDDSSNIITLTPEDHFFAHLLLAKIHGGKLWVAVHAMRHLANANGKAKRRLGCRTLFGYVRRSLADYYRSILSGPDGKIADKRHYTLCHFDGRSVTGDRFKLERDTGVTRQQISAVLRGVKMSAHGWYCKEHNHNGLTGGELISLAVKDATPITLFHHDGRVWTGIKVDFAKEFGAKLYFQTNHGDCAGWHKTATDAAEYRNRIAKKAKAAADARGGISGARNPNADKTIYKFIVIETGEKLEATKFDVKQRFGLTSSGLSSLFNGRQTKTGGISIDK